MAVPSHLVDRLVPAAGQGDRQDPGSVQAICRARGSRRDCHAAFSAPGTEGSGASYSFINAGGLALTGRP